MSSGSVYSIKMVTSVFGCILVKGTWAAGNHHCRGPLPVVRILGAIGYTSRSHFVSIDGSLNSVSNISDYRLYPALARHGDKKQQRISSVLRPVVLSFIRALQNPTFQLDNALLHVACIVRTFLDTENGRPLPCFARSPDFSK
ncbi:transposable element Tcb1 transposase [Trichonephila clavipes]|nr:transposable element Tcb1 transposase [Trichonephila clavipes]